MASWMRSAYFSPMVRNSAVGTRMTSSSPSAWLKRAGLSQVSKECRLIFFSSAERIRTQGLAVAVAVDERDIVPSLIDLAAHSGQRSLRKSGFLNSNPYRLGLDATAKDGAGRC